MNRRQIYWVLLVGATSLANVASAIPVNTTLPGGWSWIPLGASIYDTGLQSTGAGGLNGQTSPPFLDTSFGILNEPNTPWYTGTDLSSQQYIQRQVFGNYGTSSPPGPPGFRYYNFGYTGPNGPTIAGPIPTSPGSNFPPTAAERRTVSLNHWNNAFPDLPGVATFGQVVCVANSATFTSGIGWGGDEMTLLVIGGTGGGTSRFRVDANFDADWNTTAFGGLGETNNRLNMNGITTMFDPGGGSPYEVIFGYAQPLSPGQIDLFRDSSSDFVRHRGVIVGDPGPGISPNSSGTSIVDNYNVLSSILQDGSPFTVTYNSSAEIFISREFGNADARGNIGPGMQGVARLRVGFECFQAVPEPSIWAWWLLSVWGVNRARRIGSRQRF